MAQKCHFSNFKHKRKRYETMKVGSRFGSARCATFICRAGAHRCANKHAHRLAPRPSYRRGHRHAHAHVRKHAHQVPCKSAHEVFTGPLTELFATALTCPFTDFTGKAYPHPPSRSSPPHHPSKATRCETLPCVSVNKSKVTSMQNNTV